MLPRLLGGEDIQKLRENLQRLLVSTEKLEASVTKLTEAIEGMRPMERRLAALEGKMEKYRQDLEGLQLTVDSILKKA